MALRKNRKRDYASRNLLKIYYGAGEVDKLTQYQRIVIQPSYFSDSEISQLKNSGVQVLAYLNLGEEAKDYFDTHKSYHRKRMNVDWDTHFVFLDHPEWQAKISNQVSTCISRGFEGFLLDSLDVVDLFPEYTQTMLELVIYVKKQLQKYVKNNYLIANRGFSLLPELAKYIDASVFEGFSTRWTAQGNSEVISENDLQWSALKARELAKLSVDRYALDYCDKQQKQFAIDRAKYYGLIPLISNRNLTHI